MQASAQRFIPAAAVRAAWLLIAILLGALAAPGLVAAATLDVDGDGSVSADTDGQLILRHLFGFTADALVAGVVSPDAVRNTTTIQDYLDNMGTTLDVDGDGRADALTDGVLILRYMLGRTGDALTAAAVAPGSSRTDPSDVAGYLDQLSAEGQPNQAVLGPLSGATIRAYRLRDLATPVEGPFQAEVDDTDLARAGTFQLALAGIPASEWVLVTATGGIDLDANDDGLLDATPTPNQGRIHGLARAGDWRAGGVTISALSDILWRYTRNLADEVAPEELTIRLGDLIRQLLASDIDGDGVLGLGDILAFSPSNTSHRDALNFDYERLFQDGYGGTSVVSAMHAGDENTINARLDEEFGHTLSRYPVPDSRYETIRVTLASAGEGRAAATGDILVVDSSLPTEQQVRRAFVQKAPTTELIIRATPAVGSQVLAWTGCDRISSDRAECSVGLAASRDVLVRFVATDATPGAPLLDLSAATNTLYPNLVDVVADPADADLIARLALLEAGDYIVGSTGDGFLRRVTAVERVDTTHYRLETVEATLAEVVGVASGGLARALTNADLRGYQSPTPRSAARAGPDAFTGLPGVRLVPSNDPADTVFRLELGTPGTPTGAPTPRSSGSGPSVEVTLFENEDGRITAQGTLELEINVDADADYCGFFCLDSARFIVKPKATETLSLNITGKLREIEREVYLATIPFSKIYFSIGVVPVWITPKVDLYLGISGSIEAEWTPAISFTQQLEGGFVYDRVRGFDWIGNGSFDIDPDLEEIAVVAKAKVPYLRTSPSIKIYDAAGPTFPIETYLQIKARADRQWLSDPCAGVLQVSALWGISSKFRWDLSGGSKLGEFLHLDDLEDGTEFEIKAFEWPLKTWYPEFSCFSLPYMQVDGRGILAKVTAGSQTNLSTTVRLTNTGDAEIPWHVDYIDDNAIQISPDHGNLSPGQSVDVSVQVATATLNSGVYENPLTFVNGYDSREPDSRTGTSERAIRIEIQHALTVAPILTSASTAGPGRVGLAWTFDAAASPSIDGFRVDASLDGGATWTESLRIADPTARAAQITGLPVGTVWLRVAAYAAAGSTPLSNARSAFVSVAAPEPVGTSPLNDTGIDWCADGSRNFLDCPVDGYPWQDAQDGRDATHDDDSDGHAGFSFTKLDANGNPLPSTAAYWSCVRDNVTGLVWEVKTDDGGLRDKDWTYSWYNPDSATNGGSAGYADYGNNCYDSSRCDTHKFVADVNARGLCGARDWRLPGVRELLSIVANDRFGPAIDTRYFPNTQPWGVVWSSSPYAYPSYGAWYVLFDNGRVGYDYKYRGHYVRLVRGGQ